MADQHDPGALQRRAKELFLAAIELRVDERTAMLERETADDPELRSRVERLIAAASDQSTHYFEPPVQAAPSTLADAPGAGHRIGAFELEEQIGEGGFAVVWRARQLVPIQRSVALKLIKPGTATPQVIARFEAERQALALMDHPSIATVFDGGMTDDGQPWFAMELVQGRPITAYCRENDASLRTRLNLFLEVCRAVQHAHQKGVVHRDLKPSNVLVTEVDGRPVPKVIDFGIAKALDVPLAAGVNARTVEGQIIGTPAYMAPEQAAQRIDIDTRADVYGLGGLLYELLTDAMPFDEETLGSAGLIEALRVVQVVEPPLPSVRANQRGRPDRARILCRDLDWIVMRCLEKDRERRYDSVAVLGNEIDRYLAGQPVLAGPPGIRYRTRKFVQRNRAAILIACTFSALLIAGIVASTSQLLRALDAETALAGEVEHAELELARFREISLFYESVFTGLDPAVARKEDTTLLRRMLDDTHERVETGVKQPRVEATVRRVLGAAYRAVGLAEAALDQFRHAFEIRAVELPADDPDRLQSTHEYGSMLVEAGYPEQGEPLLREALRRRTEVFGRDHELTLRTLTALGVSLQCLGRLDEAAEVLAGVSGELFERKFRPTTDSIRALNSLAIVHEDKGEHERALALFRLALAQQMQVQGSEHPETLKALNNLGHILSEMERDADAIPYYEQALEAKRAVLPEGHPSLLIGMNNLASSLENVGRIEECEALYVRALESAQEGGTARTRESVMMRRNYAKMLIRAEQFERGAQQIGIAARDARATLGANDGLTIFLDGEHAWRTAEDGDLAAAEAPLRDAYERAVRELREDEAGRLVTAVRFGLVLAELDRDEGREILRAHLDAARRAEMTTLLERAEAALGER